MGGEDITQKRDMNIGEKIISIFRSESNLKQIQEGMRMVITKGTERKSFRGV